MDAIRAEHLKKTFGSVSAVDDVHLSVKEGEIFGFLGPNGAGKTTTIRLLTGVLTPDAGTVQINGIDIHRHPLDAKMQMGVIPENSTVYGDLSAEQNLQLSGKMYGMPRALREKRINEILLRLGLSDKRRNLVRTFSKGMKQRVSIACAIIHRPHVLFLDEPTSGLDLTATFHYLDLVRANIRKGKTLLLVTHHIHEIPPEVKRVVLLKQGKILQDGEKRSVLTEANLSRLFDCPVALAQANGWYQALPGHSTPH